MRLQRKRNETSDDFVSGGQMVSGAESVLCSEHGMEAGHPGLEWKKQVRAPERHGTCLKINADSGDLVWCPSYVYIARSAGEV